MTHFGNYRPSSGDGGAGQQCTREVGTRSIYPFDRAVFRFPSDGCHLSSPRDMTNKRKTPKMKLSYHKTKNEFLNLSTLDSFEDTFFPLTKRKTNPKDSSRMRLRPEEAEQIGKRSESGRIIEPER